MQISPTAAQALAVFAGNLPTFIAVVLAWMNSNARLSDIKSDLQRQITDLRNDTLRENQNTRDLLCSEFHRVEEVMDARLKTPLRTRKVNKNARAASALPARRIVGRTLKHDSLMRIAGD